MFWACNVQGCARAACARTRKPGAAWHALWQSPCEARPPCGLLRAGRRGRRTCMLHAHCRRVPACWHDGGVRPGKVLDLSHRDSKLPLSPIFRLAQSRVRSWRAATLSVQSLQSRMKTDPSHGPVRAGAGAGCVLDAAAWPLRRAAVASAGFHHLLRLSVVNSVAGWSDRPACCALPLGAYPSTAYAHVGGTGAALAPRVPAGVHLPSQHVPHAAWTHTRGRPHQ